MWRAGADGGHAGVATSELAVLSVPQLPGGSPVQIDSVQFDGGGDAHAVGKKGRAFYLTPGEHTATFTLVARPPDVPGVAGWFVPKVEPLRIETPAGVPLGAVTAGKHYELAPAAESFNQVLLDGGMSLVREKGQ